MCVPLRFENLSPLAPQREQYWLVPCGLTSTLTTPSAYAFSRALIDLAPQLVGLFAVHPPRLASLRSPDLAESLKHEHAAGIVGAHVGDGARNTVSSALIHPPRSVTRWGC